jgi:UDP-N-acetylmuramate--alanine ligase
VFQSHTYTRTLALFDDFVKCFDLVDSLTLLPIYAARELDTGLVSAEDLGEAIRNRKTVPTYNFDTFEVAAKHLSELIEPGDIVLTMGAGESVKVAEYLQSYLL